MFLKRIELHGFKSFSGKSVLDFEGRINAVVGPNGCGKSNIVDAIKWTLGEQSAKTLRGKGMEDVIFAGSSRKASMGMAEVKLVFARDEDDIPFTSYLDFPEISVGRILHRDGGSEYRLQNIPCRLKDISDVFLGTGLGSRSYSIIEQGKIGSLIVSRPEERRVLFEEAAKITRYRARRKEAEKRLEESTTNLVRINDSVRNLAGRVHDLDKQRETAIQYESLLKEKIFLMGLKISQEYLEKLLVKNSLLKQLKSLEIEINDLKTLQVTKGTEMSSLMLTRQSKTLEISLKVEDIIALERSLSQHESNYRISLNNIENLVEKRKNSEIEIRNYQEKIKAREILSGEIKDRITNLDAVCRVKEDHLNKIQLKHDDLLKEVGLSEENIQAKQNEYIKLKTKKASIEGEINTIKLNNESSLRRLSDIAELKKEKSSAIEIGQYKLLELEKQNISFLNEKKMIQAYIEGISELSWETEESLSVLRKKLASHIEKISEYSGRSKFLEKASLHSSEISDNRRIAAKLQEEYGCGVSALLDSIDVLPERVKEIQFILASEINFLLLDTVLQSDKFVESLLAEKIDGLLFSGTQKIKSNHSASGMEGLICCDSFVTCHGPVRDILSNWFYTDSLHDAMSAVPKLEVGQWVLCRTDFSVNWQGILRTKETRKSNILELKVEYESIQETLDKLELEKKEIEKNIGDKSSQLDDFRKKEKSSGAQLLEISKKHTEGRENAEKLKQLMKFSEMQLEELSGEAKRLDFQLKNSGISEKEKQLGILNDDILKFEEINSRLGDSYALQQRELGFIREELTEIRVAIETWKGKLSVENSNYTRVKEEILLWNKNIEEIKDFLDLSLSRISDEKNRIEILNSEKLKIAEKLHSVKLDRSESVKELEAIDASIDVLRKILNDLDKKQDILRDNKEALNLRKITTENALELLDNQYQEETGESIGSGLINLHSKPLFDSQCQRTLSDLKRKLEKLKPDYNPGAIKQYNELFPRYEYLKGQMNDLEKAVNSLENAIEHITKATRERFFEAFDSISSKFSLLFPRLFGGGSAKLVLGEGDPLEAGIDIIAQPPGKKVQNMELLSGGEKAMTAIALVFSMFLFRPTPFCILDEVDAPLDDSNVEKYNDLLREMSKNTQFIVITHNRRTMEGCDVLFGVTMDEPGISKVLKLNISEAGKLAAQR
ncbi:MAG: chromosome segregation protein SMC [Deltaproteobacteria bacterium]|nr:chromosome segregation protein SMC [Deltaproteobacteria bacterium]